MKVVFRDLNSSGVVDAVKALLPEWDAAVGDIFSSGQPVDILVSPANVTGRMDGGIDQVYINRFGWQLEHRLMRDIRAVHGGCLRIGEARLITTYDDTVNPIPLMICAPTMTWPPADISKTNHAYLAMRAILQCAAAEGVKALGREPTLLLPGLGTATGRMTGRTCAEQMRRAWDEFNASRGAASAGPLLYSEAEGQTVSCPECFAPVGVQCGTESGKAHPERVQAWAAAQA